MSYKEVNIESVTPMMKQYLEIKRKNEDVIIFFRLGDFYEMFFEDAITVSQKLELTLTGKNAGLSEKIPMCGIPHHSSSTYIEKLVELGYKVGICEQLENAEDVKGIVKRGIIQIISKGTYIKESDNNNNYIGFIKENKENYILSYLDISTGEINISPLPKNLNEVISHIVSLSLKEIVVDDFNEKALELLNKQFGIIISKQNEIVNLEEYNYIFEDLFYTYIDSLKYLLSYIIKTQKRNLSHLQKPNIILENQILKMNIHTKKNLELTETIRQNSKTYSLYWLLDKTKTAGGSRMLKNIIENPLIDKKAIEKRFDIVDSLIQNFILKDDLINYLKEVYDLERLVGKISFSSVNARDMLMLKNTLKVLPNIKEILTKINFYKTYNDLPELLDLLEKGIYENPPITVKEGYLIKEGYNKDLDELKDLRKGGKDFIAKFENEEKEKTGIKNLKVGYNRVFGYYIEVSKGQTDLVKEEYNYERKQTLSNCERYISPVLKEKESLILNAEEKIIKLEYELFMDIKDKTKKYIKELQEIAKIISEIDVMQSFSVVAEQNNYIRPTLTDKKEINIKNSRHPVMEKVVKENYVPNDINLNENKYINLITGPNMAGKSTYMRQTAILAIMTQIGSFIPADEATLPIFDSIYTRIGASDDLVSGESTFMVEMKEAKEAVVNATENSLVLFDELGRGTATFDGMSLAQALIEYIHTNVKCMTLFSTHYHELIDLENTLPNLKNVHVSAHEENGNITFLHKIKDGAIDKSYGIHVASLASLPDVVIKRATEILNVYENKEVKRDLIVQESFNLDEVIEESKIEKEIKNIDLNNITPVEALNILYKFKEKLK